VMRDIPDPKRDGQVAVPGEARSRARARRRPTTRRRGSSGAKDFPIDALGSGSDYTAFLDFLTIASLNLGFGGEAPTPASITPLRLVLLVHALLRLPTSPMARRCRGRSAPPSCASPTPTSCRSSSPRRRPTLRGYANEIDKLRKDTPGAPRWR
jgi:hypothetical protein